MNERQLTLATSRSCGPCMVLKNKIASLNLEVEIKDFTVEEDKEFFYKHKLKSVPRLVVEDGDTVEIIQGMDEIIEAIKNE
jgi:hypothetical protein